MKGIDNEITDFLCGVLRPMNMGLRELIALERKSQSKPIYVLPKPSTNMKTEY